MEPRVELQDGVAALSPEAWNTLVGEASPFLEWEWLASLEQAGCVGGDTGWEPRPLVIRDDERLLAACPLYVKHHSEGEFVFDWGWADAAHRAGIDYYPKLLVGVPFTPVTGSRLLTAPGVDRARAAAQLGAALRGICAEHGLSGAHINFCEADEVRALEGSGWLLRVGLQYHWRNAGYATFEDYLSHLKSKRRNQVRRERRVVVESEVHTEVLQGDALGDGDLEILWRCYVATVDAHYYGRRYLNRRFFELLGERFRHRLCAIVARRGDEGIAATLNVQKGDALYGRYWGGLEQVRNLHFEVCYYAAIQHCIEAGLQRFEPGAGGDYKFLRGFDPHPTYSLHHLNHPGLSSAVERFLEAERRDASHTIEVLKEHSQLKHA